MLERNRPFIKVDVTENINQKFDTINQKIGEHDAQLADVKKQLNLKRDKSIPIGVNDLDGEVLGIIQNGSGGAPIEVLSIPRDYSVTPIKTNFLYRTSPNLFDKSKAEIGKSVGSNGQPVNNESYAISDYIPVLEGHTYSYNGMNFRTNYAIYDANKSLLSFVNYNPTYSPITIPAGGAYLRISVELTIIDTFAIVEGDTVPIYVPYDEYELSETIKINKENIGFKISALETDFIKEVYDNYFDKTKATIGYSIGTNGSLVSNESFAVSDYIPITPGKTYTWSTGQNNIAFYKQDKSFLSFLLYNQYTRPITAPEGAYFIRITVNLEDIDKVMFVEGNTVPATYQPYGKKNVLDNIYVNSDNIIGTQKLSPLKNKRWNVLGDSFTAPTNNVYHKFIADRTGIIVNNYGISGSAVTTNGVHPMCTRYVDMTDDCDIVSVFGGINDSREIYVGQSSLGTIDDTTTDTFYGAYKLLLEGLIDKYPDKIIFTITPPQLPTSDYSYRLEDVANAIVEVSKLYGIPCLDLYHGCNGFNGRPSQWAIYHPTNQSTPSGYDIHPNSAGQNKLSIPIQKFLVSLLV